jgi:hypothetical protein
MDSLDVKKDLYLDICCEYIVKRFGKDPGINREPGRSFMTAEMVTPDDGGKFRQFNERDLTWEASGFDFTNWSMVHDGKVFVGYSEDYEQDSDFFFKVGHPREVAELLYFLVQPASCFDAAMGESRAVKLGELVTFHALIPAGNGWRALALDRLTSDIPADFRDAVGRNLVQDVDAMIKGSTCEAWKFVERWPELVGALPDAAPLIRAGYLLQPGLNVSDALDKLASGLRTTQPFLPMFMVPSREEVSCLFLREYLNGDGKAAGQLKNAFSEGNSLDQVQAAFANVKLSMPPALTDQIRLGAQVNLMRQRVMQQAECLANTRASFADLTAKYRNAILAIDQLIEPGVSR